MRIAMCTPASPARPPGRVLAIALAAAIPAAAGVAQESRNPSLEPVPPIVFETTKPPTPHHTFPFAIRPADDLAPWGLPSGLREALGTRARAHASSGLRVGCDERTEAFRYREDGSPRGAPKTTRSSALSWKLGGTSAPGDRAETAPHDLPSPPPADWLRLFDPDYGRFFSFRDLGRSREGSATGRRIQFEGTQPWSGGRDIREWEGIVTLDEAGDEPLVVEAVPRNQDALLAEKYREHVRKTLLTLGLAVGPGIQGKSWRLGPSPLGYRVRVVFAPSLGGLSLPREAVAEKFRAVSATEAVPVSTVTRRYDSYRVLDAGEVTARP